MLQWDGYIAEWDISGEIFLISMRAHFLGDAVVKIKSACMLLYIVQKRLPAAPSLKYVPKVPFQKPPLVCRWRPLVLAAMEIQLWMTARMWKIS